MELQTKYNKLTILGVPFFKNKRQRVNALCECGNIKEYVVYQLITEKTKSCGCLKIELTRERFSTHGLSKSHPIYVVWKAMNQRCYYKNGRRYKDYGGRGVTVCEEWRNFKAFYNWALSNGWMKGLQIDRFPNNNGNYEPTNCRFVPNKINSRNTRSNKMTDVKVNTAKNLFRLGAFTRLELAGIYNISPTTIGRILNNQTWM